MKQITLAELSAVAILLENEKMIGKKLKIYAENCNDPQLRQQLQQYSAKHKTHYNTLINQLTGE